MLLAVWAGVWGEWVLISSLSLSLLFAQQTERGGRAGFRDSRFRSAVGPAFGQARHGRPIGGTAGGTAFCRCCASVGVPSETHLSHNKYCPVYKQNFFTEIMMLLLFLLVQVPLLASGLSPSCEAELDAVVCQRLQRAANNMCGIEGFFCPNKTISRRVPHQFGSSECVTDVAVPCPAGFYCPTPSKRRSCDSGYYCREASAEQVRCTMGNAVCPVSEEDHQRSQNLTVIFFVIFGVFAVGSAVLNKYLILESEKATDEIVANSKKYDADVTLSARDNLRSILDMRSLTSMQSEKELKRLGSLVNLDPPCHSPVDNNILEAYRNENMRSASQLPGMAAALKLHNKQGNYRMSLGHTPRENPALLKSTRRLYSSVTALGSKPDAKQSQPKLELATRYQSVASDLSEDVPPAPMAKNPIPMLADLRIGRQSGMYEPTPVENPMDVVFKGLFLNLKSTKECILHNLCGRLVHGTITALMGPSGAGKTSLLSLLRGQAYFAETKGTLLVNGCACKSLHSYSSSIAYVSQVDVMYDELTCEENIICAALLFNRRKYSSTAEILPMVYFTLELLGLMLVRRSPVGNETLKGVSGGQKKRVSVAMEMMKEAPLFLLDEPTSGLDSASSISLFNALHTLAFMGHNIVATVHQPRKEIVNLFDDIILLAPGGRMVYCGPSADISAHFSAMGYTCDPEANVADFVMDVLAGFVKQDLAEGLEGPPAVIEALCTWWEINKYPELCKQIDSIPAGEEDLDEPFSFQEHLALTFVTLLVVMMRQIRSFQRTLPSFRFTCIIFFTLGFIIALLFGQLDLSLGGPGQAIAQISSMQLTFGLLSLTFGLRLFRKDALMRRREEEGGLWMGPYVVGKLAGCLPELFVYPLIFLFGYYPFVHSAAPFKDTWELLFFFQLSVLGLANFVAVLVPGKNSNLVANGSLVILWAFGGLEPNLETIRSRMGGFGVFVNTISPFKWSFERQIINEFRYYSEFYSPATEKVVEELDYNFSNEGADNRSLVLYFVLATFLTYLWLQWARDHFKIRRDMYDLFSLLRDKIEINFFMRSSSEIDETRDNTPSRI